MNILSIHWSINSSVALLVDGNLVGAISEERFTRKKNDSCFPKQSIDWVLSKNGLSVEDIDFWALPSNDFSVPYQIIRRYDSFTIDDYVREQDEYWYPRLYKGEDVDFLDLFGEMIDTQQYPSEYWKKCADNLDDYSSKDFRVEVLKKYYNIPEDKIRKVEHHNCHASYCFFTSPFEIEDKALVFTLDGIGDGLNATVSIANSNGDLERIYATDQANIGRAYRYLTLVLGMKPNEHEYKVMGLAPYAKNAYFKDVTKAYKDYIRVEDGEFHMNPEIHDSYFHFREKFKAYRFDNIAGGIQAFVEETVIQWVNDWIKKTGIKTVLFGGGVAMNIKAMGELPKHTDIERLHVPGNPADETNCIGAAYLINKEEGGKNAPLRHLYLGYHTNEQPADTSKLAQKYTIISAPSHEQIADLIADYAIIGRCFGPMEFGARALGNRSILARCDDNAVKERINHMIKNRDFWMPFAPIIMGEFVDNYLVNPKQLQSKYMTIGFDCTQAGTTAMEAALHPGDKTVRPQMLYREMNENLHDFMKVYQEKTGFGCLLNTSFNLHGYPIVMTEEDAIYVFVNSTLDGLWFHDKLILRQSV